MHSNQDNTLNTSLQNKYDFRNNNTTYNNEALSSQNMGKLIENVIEANNKATMNVQKTINTLLNLSENIGDQETSEKMCFFSINLEKAIEEVNKTKNKVEEVEAIAYNALGRLGDFRLEQESKGKEIYVSKKLSEAIKEINAGIPSYEYTHNNNFNEFSRSINLQENDTGFNELQKAGSKIFTSKEQAIRTTKLGFETFQKLIQDAEKTFSCLSSEKRMQVNQIQKGAVISAQTALNELKGLILVVENHQKNRQMIFSCDELWGIVEEIKELEHKVEELMKNFFFALKELINFFETAGIKENALSLSCELHILICEKMAVWSVTIDKIIKIFNTLHALLLKEEKKHEIYTDRYSVIWENIKKLRYELVECAKKIYKYLQEQMEVEKSQQSNENNFLVTENVFRELIGEIEEAKKTCKTQFLRFKKFLETEEKQQIELKAVNDSFLQVLESFFRLIVSNSKEFASNAAGEEAVQNFLNSAMLNLFLSPNFYLTNIVMNTAQNEEELRKIIDKELENFSYFIKTSIISLPPVKGPVKKDVDETLGILMSLTEKRLIISNALLKTDNFAKELIEALKIIPQSQEAEIKLFKQSKSILLENIETVDVVKNQMTKLLVELEDKKEKLKPVKNKSVAIDFTKEVDSGQQSIEKLEKINIKLLLLMGLYFNIVQ